MKPLNSFPSATATPSTLRKRSQLWDYISHGLRTHCKTQEATEGWQHASPQEQLRQESSTLLWGNWCEALPLKEEPELLLNSQPGKIVVLVSEQTWVNAEKQNKTRQALLPSVTLFVWSGRSTILGKGPFPMQLVTVKARVFSRGAEGKITAVGGACDLMA
ncbi:60S ribosomal protein L27a-like [Psammomys obesus]|uniref:60S ribosomal protein L27a-like n=1 Tax=Psammomys obesus TaxID=48139 RepID=UPI00245369D1|nr:60S ribosomal protein L27a-like [Psammomys obesus]